MPEQGGPTTQSGIFYQNSVAALYLGRLCDSTQRPDYERVISVRVETPDKVDDIVVTFADNHKAYFQAKENIGEGDAAWIKVWQDFGNQFKNRDFQIGEDRLVFQIGKLRQSFDDLKELCQRAYSSQSYLQWQDSLTRPQKRIFKKIEDSLPPEILNHSDLLEFIQHIDIESWTLRHIEQDLVPIWMPKTSVPPLTLFRLFRDRVGGKARIRGIFDSYNLRRSLQAENPSLKFHESLDIDNLRSSIKNCGSLLRTCKNTVAKTGQHIDRPVTKEIVSWLTERNEDTKNLAMLIDQAGMGKSIVMRDVLEKLESHDSDVLAIKADNQLSGIGSLDDIQEGLALPQPILEIVGRLALIRRVIILIDQIDALSLSLAHDQKALDVVLDLVARLRQIPNVRILLSCRLFDRNGDPRLNQIDLARQFTLTKFSVEQVTTVLSRINVNYSDLAVPTQKLLCIPLHLNLFVLAVENYDPVPDNLVGISSLQELYKAIWQNVVLRREAGGPKVSDRIKVLNMLTEYMNRRQTIAAPQSIFYPDDCIELMPAVNWLASAGILVAGKTEWTFLHQTFFDYCYARQFVENDGNIIETVLNSDQGLFMRPQLVQIISYLRGTRPSLYLRDFQKLLEIPNLRYHLYDLLLRWFGSLQSPIEDECVLVRRLFLDSQKRFHLLSRMYGNPGWFNFIAENFIPSWLENNDDLDNQVIPYLLSLIEIEQSRVVNILKPYLGRNEKWDNRLALVVSHINQWQSREAINLFEQVVYRLPSINRFGLSKFHEVAGIDPEVGIRLLRFILDRCLNQYLTKRAKEQEEQGENYPYSVHYASLYSELQILENTELEKVIDNTSHVEPALFLDAMLPWLDRALQTRERSSEINRDRYFWDEFSGNWYDKLDREQTVFVFGIVKALIQISKVSPEQFRAYAVKLAESSYQTHQLILTHVYRQIPETYASDALRFLISDRRRLDLGYIQQYDTRQVIKAILPSLSVEQRLELEKHILAYIPINKKRGLEGLRWRGIEQFGLLQSIPVDQLSVKGRKRLREWDKKFPNFVISDDPATSRSGFITSPIAKEIARNLSERNWLRAFSKYKGGIEHKDFFKGGAEQLARVLQELIKEDPGNWIGLIRKIPDDTEDVYIASTILGLAESSAPADWLYDVIRRFFVQSNHKQVQVVALALEKRAKENIPADLLDLLYSYLYSEPGKDEWRWTEDETHQEVYSSFMSSDRGSAFHALMQIYSFREENAALVRKWDLIEFVTQDKSTALRLGAIEQLIYMIKHDPPHAISLFKKLIAGHEILFRSVYLSDFIYWAFYKNYLELQSYITSMMQDADEKVQERGAQLACIAAISTVAMETDEALTAANELAEIAVEGPISWRRGAAIVYSHNINGKSHDVCLDKVMILLEEDDDEIQNEIGRIFYKLKSEHFYSLRKFIEAYAKKSKRSNHQFSEYLFSNGLLDPEWTISIIRLILNNKYLLGQDPWDIGAEEFIRLVLKIYSYPLSDSSIQNISMNLFDEFMGRYTGFGHKVLSEWDQR